MKTHFFSDTGTLLGRSLRYISRSLDTIITTAVMPIAFMLLFFFSSEEPLKQAAAPMWTTSCLGS